jgi:hypothetical protein
VITQIAAQSRKTNLPPLGLIEISFSHQKTSGDYIPMSPVALGKT